MKGFKSAPTSLCQQTRSPCKIVEIENGWPDFMMCDNDNVFADNCPTAIETKFNESECEKPLMETSNPSSWYEGVEGCGLQCMNPLFDQAEHDDMHVFIAVWASITAVCTLFAMLSFFIDWKNSSRYPARIIFYINVCFFLCTFGWLAQFFQDSRNEIVCRKDGTVRLGEPVGHDESPSCVIIFTFVYFFVMAGVAWFVVLSYSWKAMFQALGKSSEPLKGKTLHFHLFAWSIAFALLIASLSVSQIDGDSMSGICFIGYNNHWYRMGFLLIPIGLMLFAGGFYLFGGLGCLLSLKTGHDGLLSESAISKITWTMIRIGLFALVAFIFVFVTFASHVYEIVNQPLWDRSFRDFIRCDANITILEKLRVEIDDPAAPEAGGCKIKNRPNIAVMKLHLFAMFGTGIVMSTWVWTKASFMNWRRAWFKLIGRSDNEMKRIRRRSRIIAKAFANRHILGRGKRRDAGEENEGTDNGGFNPEDLEFSEHTITHQDPVGMDFDLNSVSQELSSNWVRNVPKMVRRRGAIMPAPVSSNPSTPVPTAPLDVNHAQILWSARASKDNKPATPLRKLPPIKTRRGAMVPPPPMSAEPTRTSTHNVEFHQPQMHEQTIPGLVGGDIYQDESMNFSFAAPVMSHMPFSIIDSNSTIAASNANTLEASHDVHDTSLSRVSRPYNLRSSTKNKTNQSKSTTSSKRSSGRRSSMIKMTPTTTTVMRQAW
uniref:smoothened homolog n=1 Tax=Styela clava TaxID=7725 RepID=UPI00193A387C|nr:smoothened homolog [Styela clava]